MAKKFKLDITIRTNDGKVYTDATSFPKPLYKKDMTEVVQGVLNMYQKAGYAGIHADGSFGQEAYTFFPMTAVKSVTFKTSQA